LASTSQERDVVVLRVTVDEIEPPIWRRVRVSTHMTLHDLHRVLQLVLGWYDCHLYSFDIGDRAFEGPGPMRRGEDARKVKLGSLGLSSGDEFFYTYDFGDDWRHHVAVESLEPFSEEEPVPWVLDGERRTPPEDCGGPPGYQTIQELLAPSQGEPNEDDAELLDWLGAGFDPDEFSLSQARNALVLFATWGLLGRRG
jgi:hypothetical protein